jgi:hypothetical protein
MERICDNCLYNYEGTKWQLSRCKKCAKKDGKLQFKEKETAEAVK